MHTILQHGCSRSVIFRLRINWEWILLKFMPIHLFISKFEPKAQHLFWLLILFFILPRILGLFLIFYFLESLFRRNQELIKELSTPEPGSSELHFPTKYSQPFFTQFKASFWKQYWSYWRNPQYNAIRFLMTATIAIFFGLLFWDKGQKR